MLILKSKKNTITQDVPAVRTKKTKNISSLNHIKEFWGMM